MDIKQAITTYCISLEAQGRTLRTIKTNRERLQYLLIFLPDSIVEIESVTPELIDHYIASLYGRNLSVFTIAGRIQVIKTFFFWSVTRGIIPHSPASHLKKPSLNHKTSKKAILQEDLELMLKKVRDEGSLLEEAMLTFLADTGCRVGELCSINMVDLNLQNLEVDVKGKTGYRMLDFTNKTADVLKLYLQAREKGGGEETPALFVFSGNRRMTTDKVYVSFRKIARALNITRFNPHSIRHRVAQGWLDQGANLELVRIKLGHADIRTTALFYANQDRTRSKRATQQFSIIKDV